MLLDQCLGLWTWREDPVGVGPTSLRGEAQANLLAGISKALQTLEQPHSGFGSCHRKELLLLE